MYDLWILAESPAVEVRGFMASGLGDSGGVSRVHTYVVKWLYPFLRSQGGGCFIEGAC